jgi:6-phosphogluconolactonase
MSGLLEVFVGGYGPAEEPGIHVFTFDPATAELRAVGEYAGIVNPSFVAVGGRSLYAVSETGLASDGRGGRVEAFRIERDGGSIVLVPLGQRETGGDHPCHLCVDPGGRWLAVSNYGTGNAVVYPIERDGSLGESVSSALHRGRSVDPVRQEGPHAHSSVFSPDGRFLIVADLGIDRLVVYAFDGGTLERRAAVATAPGTGPRHMVFHPDGIHLFVVGELDSTLHLYRWRSDGLDPISHLPTLPPEAPPSLAADVHLSHSGRRVYVSNRGHDSVAVFEYDAPATLKRIAVASCGGSWPRGFTVSPDGRHLLVANRRSDEIVVLPVDGTGIGAARHRVPVPEPSSIVIVAPPGRRPAGS